MADELKTVTDVRRVLTEEIEKLRKGDSTAASVNAVVNAVGKILSSVKLEIEYNKIIGKTPDIPFIRSGRKALPDSKEK